MNLDLKKILGARARWGRWAVVFFLFLVIWDGLRGCSQLEGMGPRVLVAVRSLEAGEGVSPMDFKVESGGIEGEVSDQHWHRLQRMKLKRPLEAGERLSWGDLREKSHRGKPPLVPPGKRGYGISTERVSYLRVGDKVDVMLRQSGSGAASRKVLEAVPILHISARDGEMEILIAATSYDIELLEKARQRGKLSVVLRNPKATTMGGFKASLGSGATNAIEIWSEEI